MTFLKRTNLKKNNSGNETYENDNSEKKKNLKMDNSEEENLKKDNSEKEQSGKGQF